jgi:integrase/recombinase XerD
MVRPAGRPIAARTVTVHDLREEFLARCTAKNLSSRTLEWYEDRTRRFAEWCSDRGIERAGDLTGSDVDDFLIDLKGAGRAPNTVRGFAQVVKTLCRFGHRKGHIENDLAQDFDMPRVPQTMIQTFSEEQLQALVHAPDTRRWKGIRDRALLLVLLDTLARVSEIVGLNAEDVDLDGRTIRVMGKGRKQRELPLGQATWQALSRYRQVIEDLRPGDPFFISCSGRRLAREQVREIVAVYGEKAGVREVRCLPHTLRHTGAKRFILAGGDVFTLQKLLGHTSLAMVRRYVELANVDVALQHQRFSPADSLLRRPAPSRQAR